MKRLRGSVARGGAADRPRSRSCVDQDVFHTQCWTMLACMGTMAILLAGLVTMLTMSWRSSTTGVGGSNDDLPAVVQEWLSRQHPINRTLRRPSRMIHDALSLPVATTGGSPSGSMIHHSQDMGVSTCSLQVWTCSLEVCMDDRYGHYGWLCIELENL